MRIALLIIACFLCHFTNYAQVWEPTTAPPNFLTDHSFGFSLDGKGYLVAGLTEFTGPSNAFMQYDPVLDEWTTLDNFPGAARGYAIGDVWDRKAYFGFGSSVDALLKDLWVFDPDSMKWSELTSCPCDARTHPTFVANNGKIFVGLGAGANGNLQDWWEYDIATDQWSQKTNFPDLRRHHPFQFAIGDYVYTGFGHGQRIFKEWYRYDPATDAWDQMADLPAEGRVAGTQFSFNNKGYVLSGDGDDHLSMEEGEFWEYDAENNSWLQMPSHPGKSRWAPASFIIDSVLYLFNGTSYFTGAGYVYQEEAFRFNLKTEEVDRSIEKVVSHDFNSVIYDVEPLSNDRWVLAVKDQPVPHALWEDSLSIVILDSIGQTEKRIRIDAKIQSEITEMGPIWVLPNEELIVRYGVGNCDAGIFEYVLEKFDTSGTSVWHLLFSDWYTPTSLSIAPDSNILYQLGSYLTKISSASGEIMWQNGFQFGSPSSYLFIPGTEDIILGDTTGLKYYSQVIIGDVVTYELTNSQPMILGDGYLNLLGIDDQEVFYGMNTESKEIFRFRKDLQPSLVMVMPDGENDFYNRFSFSKDRLAIGLNYPDLEVRVFDTLGQWIYTYENQLSGLSVNDIELTSEGLAVTGNYQSGKTADGYPLFVYQNGREEGWFKFISNQSRKDTTTVLSLAIMDIEQLELPVIDSFFSPGPEPGTLYNITGGRFRIRVANTGNEEIKSFSLNTIFNYRTNFFFCAPVSANFIQYDNQSILPGESLWIEFSDLLAQDQKTIPPQFCFWTSTPNRLPDDLPEDDLFCIDNLVSNSEVSDLAFSIFPNPANEEINILWPIEKTSQLEWRILDVYGRIVKSGISQNVNGSATIKTSELSSGVYYIVTDHSSQAFSVVH